MFFFFYGPGRESAYWKRDTGDAAIATGFFFFLFLFTLELHCWTVFYFIFIFLGVFLCSWRLFCVLFLGHWKINFFFLLTVVADKYFFFVNIVTGGFCYPGKNTIFVRKFLAGARTERIYYFFDRLFVPGWSPPLQSGARTGTWTWTLYFCEKFLLGLLQPKRHFRIEVVCTLKGKPLVFFVWTCYKIFNILKVIVTCWTFKLKIQSLKSCDVFWQKTVFKWSN